MAVGVAVRGRRPFGTWDTSAGAGTRSGDSSSGRCGCMAASCRRRASLRDR